MMVAFFALSLHIKLARLAIYMNLFFFFLSSLTHSQFFISYDFCSIAHSFDCTITRFPCIRSSISVSLLFFPSIIICFSSFCGINEWRKKIRYAFCALTSTLSIALFFFHLFHTIFARFILMYIPLSLCVCDSMIIYLNSCY